MQYIISVLSIISLLASVSVSIFLLLEVRKVQKRLNKIEAGIDVVTAVVPPVITSLQDIVRMIYTQIKAEEKT